MGKIAKCNTSHLADVASCMEGAASDCGRPLDGARYYTIGYGSSSVVVVVVVFWGNMCIIIFTYIYIYNYIYKGFSSSLPMDLHEITR